MTFVSIRTNYEREPNEDDCHITHPKNESELKNFLEALSFKKFNNNPNLRVSYAQVYRCDNIVLVHMFEHQELTYMRKKGTIEHNCFIATGPDQEALDDILRKLNDFYEEKNYSWMGAHFY